MPFENHGTRSFTWASIDKNAPAAAGVYGLSNARGWIYVGACDNIKLELMAHLQGTDATRAQHPTGFTYEICAPQDRMARQSRLVSELDPVCNQRLKI
jgi:hypothetical protein